MVDESGVLSFVTKGDANATEDPVPVLASQVVGRVVLTIPYLGRAAGFVRTPLGLGLFILLPGAGLIGLEVRNLIRKKSKPVHDKGAAVLLLLLCFGGAVLGPTPANAIAGTAAYFSSGCTFSNNEVTAGTWEEPAPADLALSPGCSKAVRPSNVPPGPACFPIATEDASGTLTLDFGEVNPGNSNNSPDVFRIKNLGTQDVQIDIVPGGGFEGFVGQITLATQPLPSTLSPGQEESVGIKLDVSHDAAPGDYTGSIRVWATDGSFSVDIPVLVTVAAKHETKADLTLSPGTSKAVRQDRCPPTFPIASQDASGTLTSGLRRAQSGRLHRLDRCIPRQEPRDCRCAGKCGSRRGLQGLCRWHHAGEHQPARHHCGGRRALGRSQAPGAQKHGSGDYTGTIRVSSADGAYSVDIPITLTVLKGCGTEVRLDLSPGTSKAVRHDRRPSSFPIASQGANSTLTLDFGEVRPGNSNNSPDVFRIKNLGTQAVRIDVVGAGAFKAFVSGVRLGNKSLPAVQKPGAQASVAIKLKVPLGTAPGSYEGTIRVTAADGSFSVDIPVTVTVLGNSGNSWLAPTQPDPVTPDPGTGDPGEGNPGRSRQCSSPRSPRAIQRPCGRPAPMAETSELRHRLPGGQDPEAGLRRGPCGRWHKVGGRVCGQERRPAGHPGGRRGAGRDQALRRPDQVGGATLCRQCLPPAVMPRWRIDLEIPAGRGPRRLLRDHPGHRRRRLVLRGYPRHRDGQAENRRDTPVAENRPFARRPGQPGCGAACSRPAGRHVWGRDGDAAHPGLLGSRYRPRHTGLCNRHTERRQRFNRRRHIRRHRRPAERCAQFEHRRSTAQRSASERSRLLRRGPRSSGSHRIRLAPGPGPAAGSRAGLEIQESPDIEAIPHAFVRPCTKKGAVWRPLCRPLQQSRKYT